MFIANVSIDPEGFALACTLEEAPRVEMNAERVAAHSTEWVMPCLWATAGDLDALDAALRSDPTVDEIVTATAFDDETFYQVEWSDDIVRHVNAVVDREATVLDAAVVDGEWRLRLRFVSREQFETFREYLDEQGLAFRLRDLTERRRTARNGAGSRAHSGTRS